MLHSASMGLIEIIKKYYKGQRKAENVLLLHGILVATKAFEIAKMHSEWEIDLDFIFETSFLHDIGIYLTYAPKIGCFGPHPYICHGYLGATILRKENWFKHAWVCERHTGSGITKEDVLRYRLPIPYRDFLPKTIEEKLICFADKFYSKYHPNKIRSIDQIRQSLERYGEEAVFRFEDILHLFLK